MKRRRLAFGGSMCACQPLGNPRSPALFGQRMGKARDEGRLFGTDRPLPGSLPRVSLRRLATRKMLPEAAVPVLETLREHNPLLFDLVLKRQLRAGHQRLAASIFETRRFFDRKPA